MVKHQQTHPDLDVDGCYGCKIANINMSAAGFRMEREGSSATMGMTNREYVRSMYETRRRRGQPDPEPMNRKSAAFAPKRGVVR